MASKHNAMFPATFVLMSMCLIADAAVNFNRDTQICCNATVFDKGNSRGCCGSTLYVDSEALCCGEQVFPYKGLSEFGNAPFMRYGCCFSPLGSAKPYDRSHQECCDGEVMEKPDKNAFYGCCSGALYNAATHRCCDQKLHDHAAGNECCGDKIYNTSMQMCCQRWERKGDKVEREFAELHDLKGPESSCCGPVAFDVSKNVCCNDHILPKPEGISRNEALCCEGRVVDNARQLCCRNYNNATDATVDSDGRAMDRAGPFSSCCGLAVYDSRHQVCCNDTILPKPAGADGEPGGACCGDQIQTSFRSQLCVKGRLVERNSTDFWNCGDEGALYNIHTQTCCFGQVLEGDGDMGCCFTGSRIFDKKKELCCEDGILALSEQDIKEGKVDCCYQGTRDLEISVQED